MAIDSDALFAMFDRTGRGLEIGPSYNPLVPKSSGADIETFDHVDQAGLVDKYKSDTSVDTSKIEPVDHVSRGRSLAETIPERGLYDYIIASHMIEHTPDMIGFVEDAAALLKPSGLLVLVVPDCSFCFDVFRPLSSTGQILQAHIEGRRQHTPGIGFDHVAYSATRGGKAGWFVSDTSSLSLAGNVLNAKAFFEALRYEKAYHDLHAWQFTPSSFRLIIRDLFEANAISLAERAFHAPMQGYEFYITLGRSPSQLPDRLQLALDVLREVKRVKVC